MDDSYQPAGVGGDATNVSGSFGDGISQDGSGNFVSNPAQSYSSAVPADGAQTDGSPDYGAQAYGAQAYGAQTYGAQTYGAQADGAQAYGAPDYGAQAYGAPAYGAPAYGAPMPGAPVYGAQVYGAPADAATAPAVLQPASPFLSQAYIWTDPQAAANQLPSLGTQTYQSAYGQPVVTPAYPQFHAPEGAPRQQPNGTGAKKAIIALIVIVAVIAAMLGVNAVQSRLDTPQAKIETYMTALKEGRFADARAMEGGNGASLTDDQAVLLANDAVTDPSQRISDFTIKPADKGNSRTRKSYDVTFTLNGLPYTNTISCIKTNGEWKFTDSLLFTLKLKGIDTVGTVSVNGKQVSSANAWDASRNSASGSGLSRYQDGYDLTDTDTIELAAYPGVYAGSATADSTYLSVTVDGTAAVTSSTAPTITFSATPTDELVAQIKQQVRGKYEACFAQLSAGNYGSSECAAVGMGSVSGITASVTGDMELTADDVTLVSSDAVHSLDYGDAAQPVPAGAVRGTFIGELPITYEYSGDENMLGGYSFDGESYEELYGESYNGESYDEPVYGEFTIKDGVITVEL
ncbi:hypothetical protein [Pseudoscardovia suis]|uniref:hypothetical protein n=1 Tax=Pseudoscardovia suis TaxID=987063 RepID=UPI003F9BA7B5